MMVLTSRWLTLGEASSRLDIPEYQALDLAVAGRLDSRLLFDHRELCAISVGEFASECSGQQAGSVAVHVDIPVRQGHLDDEGEDDYAKERQT